MSEVKTTPAVQPVFDKFAIELDGKVTMFDTYAEAAGAAVMAANDEAFTARAKAFTASLGIEGKNAASKERIVKEFLAFEVSLEGADEEDGETAEA